MFRAFHTITGSNKAVNQDRCAVLDDFYGDGLIKMVIVCDGHGPKGEVAAQLVVENFPKILRAHFETLQSEELIQEATLSHLVRAACQQTDDHVKSVMGEDDVKYSGTTMAAVLYTSTSLLAITVGDSAVVVCARNARNDYRIVLNTKRHDPSDPREAERIRRRGGSVRNGRVVCPLRQRYTLAMSRSFGDEYFKQIGVVCDPSIYYCDIAPVRANKEDVVVVVASDGIWDVLEEEYAASVILSYNTSDMNEAVFRLCEYARAEWSVAHSRSDDITAVVLRTDCAT